MDELITALSPNGKAITMQEDQKDFLLSEHAALKSEILSRMAIQHQIIALAVIGLGTFITLDFTSPITLPFVYPILASVFAGQWIAHDHRIRQHGRYIRDRIERAFLDDDQGWETIGTPTGFSGLRSLFATIGSRGAFVLLQLTAILIGLLKTSFSEGDVILLFVDVIVIGATLFVARRPSVKSFADVKR